MRCLVVVLALLPAAACHVDPEPPFVGTWGLTRAHADAPTCWVPDPHDPIELRITGDRVDGYQVDQPDGEVLSVRHDEVDGADQLTVVVEELWSGGAGVAARGPVASPVITYRLREVEGQDALAGEASSDFEALDRDGPIACSFRWVVSGSRVAPLR